MTPTEKGRRRDALLYGFDTRLQLCDMIANRESDLEDARKENDRLRESVKRLMTQRDERLARAEAENAKLRELLRIVVNKYCESGTCDGCPILGKDESCPY